MKASQCAAVSCSTRSRSAARNQARAGRSQCSKVPGSPRQPVKAPLTSRSTVTAPPAGRSSGRSRIASLGPVGSHWTGAAVVQGQGELDGRVAGQLAVGVAVAAVGRQQGPVAVVPAQARLADAAVDLGLDVDAEECAARLGPLVADAEPLEVLARRLGPPDGAGQQVRAHRDEVGGQDPDRPVPPASARSPAGWSPPGSAGTTSQESRSVNQSSRRPTARPPTIARKWRPALGLVPLGGPDVGVQADGRVSRRRRSSPGRRPGRSSSGCRPAPRAPSARSSADSVRSGRLGRTTASWCGLEAVSAPSRGPPTGSGAGRRPAAAGSGRARGC